MTASLTDARLSLLLQIQNLGADPFGTSARLQLVLAVPPRATVVAPGFTGGLELEDVGRVATFEQENDESIKLIVTSDIELNRLWTECFDDGSSCSIVYRALTDHRSVLRPGEFRRFHVSIGLTPARRQE